MTTLFNDPKFQQMKDEDDWLNLAIQPFEFSIIEAIHKLPDVIELDEDLTKSELKPDGYYVDRIQFNADSLIAIIADTSGLERNKISFMKSVLSKQELYQLKVEGDTIDLENGIYPKLFIHRVKDLDEEQVMDTLADHVRRSLGWYEIGNATAKRLNEMLDTFDSNKSESGVAARRSTSVKKKSRFLSSRVYDVIKNNEWDIKNGDLIMNLGEWLKGYLGDENLKCLSNITRLKCMVHKGEPIYSMEEV